MICYICLLFLFQQMLQPPPKPPNRTFLPRVRSNPWLSPAARLCVFHRTSLRLFRPSPLSTSPSFHTCSMNLTQPLRWRRHHRFTHLPPRVRLLPPRPSLPWPRCRNAPRPQLMSAPLPLHTSLPTPLTSRHLPSLCPSARTTPTPRTPARPRPLPPSLSQNLRLHPPYSPSSPTPLSTRSCRRCSPPTRPSREVFLYTRCPSFTRTPCTQASPRVKRGAWR